jgi:hypothetical protein
VLYTKATQDLINKVATVLSIANYQPNAPAVVINDAGSISGENIHSELLQKYMSGRVK